MADFPPPSIRIALDAMGGDNAPASVLKGANIAAKRYPHASFLLFGDENKLSPLLKTLPTIQARSEIFHTEEEVLDDDKPSAAIRQRRDSSMAMAIKAVREGKADCAVSAGNTGALMAMAKIMLGMLDGVDRPAIASVVPTIRGQSVILDLGANVDCTANHLFQFALMGDAFAKAVLGLRSPTIGILNIGSEEIKGNEAVKEAGQMIRETPLQLSFHGNIEGDDINIGTVDVVVTDGFSGNISLKTSEGTAKMCMHFLKESLRSSILAKIGYFFVKTALSTLFKKLDPSNYNGAMFLGLKGIAVKSHGGTDARGFANAIGVAAELVNHRINDQIIREVEQSHNTIAENGDEQESTNDA